MGYTALYRKFRPILFSEIVGQEHITRTLKNQIIAGIISIGFFIITWVLPEFNSSLESYSFINMFYKYTQGQIDIGDTVTFITFTITCLLLTAVVMQRRKSVK